MNYKLRIAIPLVTIVLATTGIFLSLSGGPSKPGPRATLIAFTTALAKRDFYDACQLYSKEVIGQGHTVDPGMGSVTYTGTRWCAVGLEGGEAMSLMFGLPVFENFQVADKPGVYKGHPAPKNGLVYKVTYYQGVIYVGLQRDRNGTWKIASIT